MRATSSGHVRRPRSREIAMHAPNIRPEAVAAAADALRSGWLGQGPRTAEFERAFADYVGAPECVAVNSGTAALHLALAALDLPEGSDIATTPLTWIATHHAIAYVGCRPLLVDIDPATGNIDVEALERALTPRTRAILPVHYAGYPCELDEIRAIADRRGLPVVEDCAHALGARYRGRGVGSAGTLNCFSFGPPKNLTTGNGGAVTTTSREHAERIRALRSLGVRRTVGERLPIGGPYREGYDIGEVGYRYELGDLAAAVGLAQLPYVDEDNARRAELAGRYARGLAGVRGLELPSYAGDRTCAYHLFVVLVERRCDLAAKLGAHGVHVGVHYPPNTLLGDHSHLPGMLEFSRRTLTLPLHTLLSDDDVDEVTELIRSGW